MKKTTKKRYKPLTKIDKLLYLAKKYEMQYENPIKKIIESYKESKEE